jgi:hypothetical protein
MPSAIEYKIRLLIPRWLTYGVASSFGELGENLKNKRPSAYSSRNYTSIQFEWKNNKSIPYAIELVSFGLLINDYENPLLIEAANFILDNRNMTSDIAVELASRALNTANDRVIIPEPHQYEVSVEAIRGKIAALKYRCRDYNVNAIAWADLAFYYSMLAQKEQEIKSMSIAVSLGHENRFILRSASRLFTHYGSPDYALTLLRGSEISKYDPWIMASEISISESINKASKLSNYAQRLIANSEKVTINNSELFATMGTLEFSHGAIKKCKKLINSSLQKPTENCLAQAEWLADKLGAPFKTPLQNSASFEAQTLQLFNSNKYSESVDACNKWLRFQPFSSMPAVNGSYVASIALEDYKHAIEICEIGLQSSPNEIMLINNYAFALLQCGRLDDAEKVINSVDVSGLEDRALNTLAATTGLLKYKQGDVSNARELYAMSTEKFAKNDDKRALAIALTFWAEEEKEFDMSLAASLLEKAKQIAKKEKMHELLYKIKNKK